MTCPRYSAVARLNILFTYVILHAVPVNIKNLNFVTGGILYKPNVCVCVFI